MIFKKVLGHVTTFTVFLARTNDLIWLKDVPGMRSKISEVNINATLKFSLHPMAGYCSHPTAQHPPPVS